MFGFVTAAILLACKRCSWYYRYCRGTSAGSGCKTTLFVTGKVQNIEHVLVWGGVIKTGSYLCVLLGPVGWNWCWFHLMILNVSMFWYFKGSTLTFFVLKWICLSLISLTKSLGREETPHRGKKPIKTTLKVNMDNYNSGGRLEQVWKEHWSWPRHSTATMLELTSVWELSLLISGVWLRVHQDKLHNVEWSGWLSRCFKRDEMLEWKALNWCDSREPGAKAQVW